MLLGRHPTLWVSAFRAVLYVAILFGFDLSDAQVAGIIVALEAVLALFNQSEVTANFNVVERVRKDDVIVAGFANERVKEGVPIRERGDDPHLEDEPPLYTDPDEDLL